MAAPLLLLLLFAPEASDHNLPGCITVLSGYQRGYRFGTCAAHPASGLTGAFDVGGAGGDCGARARRVFEWCGNAGSGQAVITVDAATGSTFVYPSIGEDLWLSNRIVSLTL